MLQCHVFSSASKFAASSACNGEINKIWWMARVHCTCHRDVVYHPSYFQWFFFCQKQCCRLLCLLPFVLPILVEWNVDIDVYFYIVFIIILSCSYARKWKIWNCAILSLGLLWIFGMILCFFDSFETLGWFKILNLFETLDWFEILDLFETLDWFENLGWLEVFNSDLRLWIKLRLLIDLRLWTWLRLRTDFRLWANLSFLTDLNFFGLMF